MSKLDNSNTRENLTIRLHWRGPFTLDEVQDMEDGNGLYLFTGKRPYEREASIQYCGITEGQYRRRFANHQALEEINRDLQIWLGEVAYPVEHTRTHLEIAEATIVYFWQPELNTQLKYRPPRPTTVISHWFKRDGTPRYNQQSIYSELYDVLCWDGDLWRTGNLKVWADAEPA